MKKRKNILLVTEYYPPHWTGIANTFYILARQLHKNGHRLTVLTTKFSDNLPLYEITEGVSIIRTPYLVRFSRLHYSLSGIARAFSLIPASDVLVINSPHSNILPITLLGKFFRKRVYIYHQGDLTLPRQTGSQTFHLILERLFDAMTLPSMALADRISTYTNDYALHSRVMKHFMYKFFPYIPPLSLPSAHSSSKTRKTMIALGKEHKLIGFAGRFVEEKGFDILYQAITLVLQKIPDAHFVFAGQTEMGYEPFFKIHKTLIDSQNPHVSYLGLLSKEELSCFYRGLDVFVSSSRSDCFPHTQIEAAISATPLVCTNIPGSRILVAETGFGVLVEPENPQALAGGITEVIQNRGKYLSRSKNVKSFLRKDENFRIR